MSVLRAALLLDLGLLLPQPAVLLADAMEPPTLPHPPALRLHPTESTAAPPTQPLGGRIGQPAALPVPRVGSAPDTRLLGGAAGATGPSAPLGNGSRGQLASAPPEDPSKYAFYNVKRYRVLFNVDTADVLWRMFHAVLLFFKGDFLEYVGGNPDL